MIGLVVILSRKLELGGVAGSSRDVGCGILVLVLRSGGGLGGFVLGFLGGDGDVFLRSRGGPAGGVEGVAVRGASLQGGHVAETIQRDRIAVAVARLELGELGGGVVVDHLPLDRKSGV